MRGVVVVLAVLVSGCTGDRITNVYGAGNGGQAATGGGGESASGGGGSGATGGSGGLGGNGSGGGGGAGGAPCVPKACADIHGVCGPTDDGCGVTIDCPVSDCGATPGDPWLFCHEFGVCVCSDASSTGAQGQCIQSDIAKAFCGAECMAAFCGEPPKPDAPLWCTPIGEKFGGDGPAVWCCQKIN